MIIRKGTGLISGTKVIVIDNELKSFLRSKGFGEEEGTRQNLSLIEALFLMEMGKMNVSDGKRNLKFQDLIKKGNEIEENFYSKYLVYKDLRERGFLVRTGLKFGSDFRVYSKGKTIKSGHSDYLIQVVPEEYRCSFPDIARSVRLSQNVNKDMIYAIVDEEGDITYYRINRMKL